MKNPIQLAMVCVAALSMFACGGAKLAPGKDNAANAFYSASKQGTAANSTQSLFNLARENAGSGTLDITVNCEKSGTASIHYDFLTSDILNGKLNFDLKFANCNQNGKTSIDGTLTTKMTWDASSSSAEIALKMTGKINFSGEVSDFITADITETVSASVTNTTASATVTLNGTLQNSSGTYTWNNEQQSVTADISAASASNNT